MKGEILGEIAAVRNEQQKNFEEIKSLLSSINREPDEVCQLWYYSLCVYYM